MANHPNIVQNFLKSVAQTVTPQAKYELSLMTAIKNDKQNEGSENIDNPDSPDNPDNPGINAWDLLYYKQILKQNIHKYTSNDLKDSESNPGNPGNPGSPGQREEGDVTDYLSLRNCLKGLAVVCDKLFRVELRVHIYIYIYLYVHPIPRLFHPNPNYNPPIITLLVHNQLRTGTSFSLSLSLSFSFSLSVSVSFRLYIHNAHIFLRR